MVQIKGSTIRMTRGDTLDAELDIRLADGSSYEMQEGDRIRFALKRRVTDKCVLIAKEIPAGTLRLRMESEETKLLRPDWAPYVYDVQLTTADGTVDTLVERGKFIVTDEVE